MIIECSNEQCPDFGVQNNVPDDGSQVSCGVCGSTLREIDLSHPDYPFGHEPTLEELVDQRLRDLGII